MSQEINLTHLVMDAVQAGISAVLQKQTESYGNPVAKAAEAILSKHISEISALLDEAVTTSLGSMKLRETIKEEYRHKVAKLLVAKLEGETEKRVNELRADPVMRAKITLAVQQAISNG